MEQSQLLRRNPLLTIGDAHHWFLTEVILGSCLMVALPPALLQAEQEPNIPSASAPTIVQIRPIDEAEFEGRLTALDGEALTIVDRIGETRSWSLSEIRSLRITREAQASALAPPVVLLANDDCFYGTVQTADEDTLTLLWTVADPPQTLTVPLETVRSFAFRQPEDELARINYRRLWALSNPKVDVLYSTENTQVRGEFLGVVEGNAQLKNALGVIRTPVTDIIAVVMNSELLSLPPPDGPYGLVSLTDGSRLSLISLQLEGEQRLVGRTGWGAEISFPLKEVASVQFLADRVISLVDLQPAAYKFTPYLTHRYPLVINRNVKGGRLQLRGETYAAGLGVSTKSEVTYDLTDGGYERFEAVVGVDDVTGGLGDVVFAVEVDGVRVYESGSLSGQSPAATVGPIPVAGAERLTLVVDFGRLGNVQDVADWCDPVLIKPPK